MAQKGGGAGRCEQTGIKKHRLTCTTTSDGKEQPHQLRIEKVKLRCYYTTISGALQPEQEKILSITEKLVELIPTGRANAIPMRDLATLLNISQRAVRVIVQRARELGSPICSEWENRGGYYFPADEREARSYLRQQRARIKSANAALNGVIKYLQFFAVPEDTQYD